MDLESLKPSETIIQIVHPKTGMNIGLTVTLMSLDDARMKKVKRQIQDKSIQLNRRGGKTFNAEEVEENTNLILFNAMTGWAWGIPTDSDGKPVEGAEALTYAGKTPAFNQVNVITLFKELEWFRTQIDEALGDHKSFFPS